MQAQFALRIEKNTMQIVNARCEYRQCAARIDFLHRAWIYSQRALAFSRLSPRALIFWWFCMAHTVHARRALAKGRPCAPRIVNARGEYPMHAA
jgi:hypothetical protein